jgi:hypothetical protein
MGKIYSRVARGGGDAVAVAHADAVWGRSLTACGQFQCSVGVIALHDFQ